MWVLGYGSLMWNDWERMYDGTKHTCAVLLGYSRAFNKKSVKNWGSRTNPCPTLGLEVGEGVKCVGVAFEYPDEKGEEVLEYLRKRGGEGYILGQLSIKLSEGQ